MNHKPYLKTTEVNQKLGFMLTSKFIIEELGIKPVCETKMSYSWDDIDEIRIKLAKYLIDSVNKEEFSMQDLEKGRYRLA